MIGFQSADLHEGLRVVTGPLLEILSLFESLKAREDGNKCNPGRKMRDGYTGGSCDEPLINLVEYLQCLGGAVYDLEVSLHPRNKVVFKCPLNSLMEKIEGEKLVYIRMWEVGCEGLALTVRTRLKASSNI